MGTVRLEVGFCGNDPAVRLKTGFKNDVTFPTVFRDSAKKKLSKIKTTFFRS